MHVRWYNIVSGWGKGRQGVKPCSADHHAASPRGTRFFGTERAGLPTPAEVTVSSR